MKEAKQTKDKTKQQKGNFQQNIFVAKNNSKTTDQKFPIKPNSVINLLRETLLATKRATKFVKNNKQKKKQSKVFERMQVKWRPTQTIHFIDAKKRKKNCSKVRLNWKRHTIIIKYTYIESSIIWKNHINMNELSLKILRRHFRSNDPCRTTHLNIDKVNERTRD